MNIILFSLFIEFASTGFLVETNPVSLYTFENGSRDKMGLNHGIPVNVSYPFMDKSNTDPSAEFFGANSFIDLASSFDFENRTISLRFLAKEISDGAGILYASDNPNLKFGFAIISVKKDRNSPLTFAFNFSGEIFTTPIRGNEWHHVAIVTKSKEYQFFINGKMVSSGVAKDFIKSGNGATSALLGCSRGKDRFFTGLIDDLAIYNTSLSENEIQTLAKP